MALEATELTAYKRGKTIIIIVGQKEVMAMTNDQINRYLVDYHTRWVLIMRK